MNVNVLLNRPWIHGWELRQGIVPFAEMVTKAMGMRPVHVSLTDQISTAAINGTGALFLANVKDDAKVGRPLLIKYIGFVVHELLHHKFTNFSVGGDYGQDNYLRTLHNAVEDVWIERQGIAKKFLPNCEGILTDLVNQMVAEALTRVSDWSDPAQYPFAFAIWGRRYANKVPLAEGLEPIFNEASNRIHHVVDSHGTLAIAKWLLSQLKALPEAQEKQQGQQGEEDGQEGQEGEKNETTTPGAGSASRPTSGEAFPVEPSIDPGEAMGVGGTRSTDFGKDKQHLYQDADLTLVNDVPAKLRFEVRKLFDNTGATLFDRNRKAGSLDSRALHKVGVTERVFKRRTDIDGIDSAVVLMIDVSGSMGDMTLAASAAAALSEALTSAGVNVGVVTFTNEASVAAPVGASRTQLKKVFRNLVSIGGTNDYAGLVVSHNLLLPRDEQRKVVFVISDGHGDRDRRASLRDQIRSGAHFGITTVGVGIGVDIGHVYPNSVRINSVADLGAVAFKQIKLAA